MKLLVQLVNNLDSIVMNLLNLMGRVREAARVDNLKDICLGRGCV